MFRADQPIESYKEDILGRHSFAKALARAILRYNQKDSVSIALYGEWGSGKTSIINMAMEEIEHVTLNEHKKNAPITIKFNPWYFSDQNQLIAQFFNKLSLTLDKDDKAKKHTKLGQTIQTYAGFFEPFSYIPMLSSFGEAAKAIKAVGIAAEKAGQAETRDLIGVKAELHLLLERFDKKIIIVIDDVDRLNNVEIRQIFQLAKSLADFPNTIYLLSFDKDVVINALKKVQEGSGVEYLEKVIQVPFEIPLISKDEVARLLFSQLDELIKDIPEDKWDQTYWGNIYQSGLKYFFNNIRAVNRYINTLSFGFEMVRDEVNIIDFLSITAIQVFLPDLYYGIRDNKDLFAGISDSVYRESEETKTRNKFRLDEIFSKVSEPPQEILQDFLERLFPKLQNVGYGHDSLESWRKKGHICSPDMFDTYFRLSLPKGELSQNEIRRVLATGHDSALFAKELLKLNEDGKIIRFLERLEDYTREDIPENNIELIITALMDVGDLFPEGKKGFFETDTPMRVLRIFYQLSHRFDAQAKRFEIFKSSMEKANESLYTVVDEVAVQCQQHGKYTSKENPEPEEKRTVSATQLKELERLACNKIVSWARSSRLSKHKYLVSILFMWKRWGSKQDIEEFLSSMIESDSGLVDFVTSFLSESRSHGMSDYIERIDWRINLKNVEEFVEIKEIEPRIRHIFSSPDYHQLEDRKKLAIKTFLDTYDGKIKDRF